MPLCPNKPGKERSSHCLIGSYDLQLHLSVLSRTIIALPSQRADSSALKDLTFVLILLNVQRVALVVSAFVQHRGSVGSTARKIRD